MTRSNQGEGISQNAFSSNLNTKSENFPQSWWNIHLKIKPWQFYRIMEGFILRLRDYKLFQTWGIDISFEKLTPEIQS